MQVAPSFMTDNLGVVSPETHPGDTAIRSNQTLVFLSFVFCGQVLQVLVYFTAWNKAGVFVCRVVSSLSQCNKMKSFSDDPITGVSVTGGLWFRRPREPRPHEKQGSRRLSRQPFTTGWAPETSTNVYKMRVCLRHSLMQTSSSARTTCSGS